MLAPGPYVEALQGIGSESLLGHLVGKETNFLEPSKVIFSICQKTNRKSLHHRMHTTIKGILCILRT